MVGAFVAGVLCAVVVEVVAYRRVVGRLVGGRRVAIKPSAFKIVHPPINAAHDAATRRVLAAANADLARAIRQRGVRC